MSWAVELVIDGGQRDGRISRYLLVEDLVALQATITGSREHVFEIHAYQTSGNGEEEVARALVERRRAGKR